MMKKAGCLVLCLCVLAAMTGCARKSTEEKAPVETLPPAKVGMTAPDGDRMIREPADYLLYVPRQEAQQLSAQTVHIDEADLKDTAAALVRRLLEVTSGETGRRLELYRDMPVEISRGTCTVNLSSSGLQLSYSEYYRLALAISTTLCGLKEIRYVNILAAGQSVALDSAGRLPLGSLSGHENENLSVLWEQMEAKRTPLGNDMSKNPLSSYATLYYPLPEGRGIGWCQFILFPHIGRLLFHGLFQPLAAGRKSVALLIKSGDHFGGILTLHGSFFLLFLEGLRLFSQGLQGLFIGRPGPFRGLSPNPTRRGRSGCRWSR
jgi:hypothetical protein